MHSGLDTGIQQEAVKRLFWVGLFHHYVDVLGRLFSLVFLFALCWIFKLISISVGSPWQPKQKTFFHLLRQIGQECCCHLQTQDYICYRLPPPLACTIHQHHPLTPTPTLSYAHKVNSWSPEWEWTERRSLRQRYSGTRACTWKRIEARHV